MIDAGAGVEFSGSVVLGQFFLAAHGLRMLAATAQVVQRVLPVLRVAHRGALISLRALTPLKRPL